MAGSHALSFTFLPKERWVSGLEPFTGNRIRRDFSTAQKTVATGVSAGRATYTNTAWNIWVGFTAGLGLDPFIQTFKDKVPILQIFAHRVRSGELAADGNPVRARTAEDYIRFVAQTFQHVGTKDPRLNSAGKQDFRLQRTWSSWKREDPAPNRVKPVPIQVIRRVAGLAERSQGDAQFQAASDMIIIAFFFLLRPGEYTDTPSESTPFRLCDSQVFVGEVWIYLATDSLERIQQGTFVSLTFTDQKNGVQGEVIGIGRSGDPYLCPVKAIVWRVLYVWSHNVPPVTPLARVADGK